MAEKVNEEKNAYMFASRAWGGQGLARNTHPGAHLALFSHLHLLLDPQSLLVSVTSDIGSLTSQDLFPSNLTPSGPGAKKSSHKEVRYLAKPLRT